LKASDLLDRAVLQRLIDGPATTVEERAQMALPLPKPGEIGRRHFVRVDAVKPEPVRCGNDPDYLTSRIARDRPDVLERMKAGGFPSVRAAALGAGIVRRTIIIPMEPAAAARSLPGKSRQLRQPTRSA
jgi:hypothetical protein